MSFCEPSSSGRLTRRAAMAVALVAGMVPAAARAAPHEAPPWLGVALASGPAGGVVIDFVFRKSPAEAAGLKGDDLLVNADGVPLERPADLVAQVRRHRAGETLKLLVRRGGRERMVKVVLVAHPGEAEVVRRMHVGTRAADLPGLTAVQGSVFSAMKDVRGRVVLVEFFASWCAGCKAQAPLLSDWHKRHASRGLQVMAVTAEERHEAKNVAASWKLPYAVASDAGHASHRVYHVSGIPALFVVDRAGIVREAVVGYRPSRREPLEKLIETLLSEKK